jgi:hypothetical protein
MTNAYDSRIDGDRLYVPPVGEIRCFSVTPQRPSSARFDVFITTSIDSKDALIQFFQDQKKLPAQERGFVTASHRDGTSLELTVTEGEIGEILTNRRFELRTVMENQNLRKNTSIIQGKTQCSTII